MLFAIDLEHHLLPNAITLPGIVVGFAFSLFTEPGWVASLIGIILGGGVLCAIAEAYYRIRHEEGLGMGDVKMLAMIGAFLGWKLTLMTLMMASFAGSIVGLALIMLRRGGMKYALPFGTFLAHGRGAGGHGRSRRPRLVSGAVGAAVTPTGRRPARSVDRARARGQRGVLPDHGHLLRTDLQLVRVSAVHPAADGVEPVRVRGDAPPVALGDAGGRRAHAAPGVEVRAWSLDRHLLRCRDGAYGRRDVCIRPILPAVENEALGLWLAFAFLIPPIWLAVYDHRATSEQFSPESADTGRIIASGVAAALAVWLMGTAAVPWRFSELGDFTTSQAGLAFGTATSLAMHLGLFMGVALVLAGLLRAMRIVRIQGHDFGAIAGLAFAVSLLVVGRLVFAGLSFTGLAAWLLAACVALVLTLTWSGMARRLAVERGRPVDAFVAWLAPVPFARSRAGAAAGLVILPFASFAAILRIEQFDWDFLVQNLGVVLTWLIACAFVHTMVGACTRQLARVAVAASVVLLAGASVGAGGRIDQHVADRTSASPFVPEFVLDGYATVDPSYRLVRHLFATEVPGSSEFYAFIASHSLIQHVDVAPVDVDFTRELGKAPSPPHIFLFVIDSLRRDYLSPYNPAVRFTPAFGAFGAEEYAFQRAFTRYGGTGMSMPAIWSGSMLLHKEYVQPFQPMNALEKLLRANSYHTVMSMDHITEQIVEPSTVSDELDKGRNEMQYRLLHDARGAAGQALDRRREESSGCSRTRDR